MSIETGTSIVLFTAVIALIFSTPKVANAQKRGADLGREHARNATATENPPAHAMPARVMPTSVPVGPVRAPAFRRMTLPTLDNAQNRNVLSGPLLTQAKSIVAVAAEEKVSAKKALVWALFMVALVGGTLLIMKATTPL